MNQRKAGVILQYMQLFCSMFISIIVTPMMLRILGDNEYGIYNVSSSIINYLSLLSLGLGTSYIRFYFKVKNNSSERSVLMLNGLYLLVFSIMGIVALIGGLFLSFNVSIFFNSSYSEYDLWIARILMIFLTINLSVSFPMTIFTSYVSAQEKFIFQKIIGLGRSVIGPVLTIVVLLLGYGSIAMVIASTIVSLIVDAINIFYCIVHLKIKFSFKNLDFKLLKEIFLFSIFLAINQIIDQINWQTDIIIWLFVKCCGGDKNKKVNNSTVSAIRRKLGCRF